MNEHYDACTGCHQGCLPSRWSEGTVVSVSTYIDCTPSAGDVEQRFSVFPSTYSTITYLIVETMSYTTEEEVCPDVHDVIIVGAGPCGLAVAARIKGITGSRETLAQTAIRNKKTGQIKPPSQHCRDYSTLVLDSSGYDWMAQWNRLFETFGISHLRSPIFFHPDPHDRDGLLAFAHEQGRE